MQFSIVISFHFLVMSGNKDSSLISEETKMTLGEHVWLSVVGPKLDARTKNRKAVNY